MDEHTVVTENKLGMGAAKFRQRFCDYLTESLETSKRILTNHTRKRREGLMVALRSYVETLPDNSPALTALSRLEGAIGRRTPGDTAYSPGSKQAQVISQLGTGTTPDVSPVDLVYEVLAAGAEDARLALTTKVVQGVERVRKETERSVRDRFEKATIEAQEAEHRARVELDQAKIQLRSVTAERDFLNELVEGEPLQQSNGQAPVRRQKVEDAPNVYRTVTKGGSEQFEVKVGSHPWETLESLEAAVTRREELSTSGFEEFTEDELAEELGITDEVGST